MEEMEPQSRDAYRVHLRWASTVSPYTELGLLSYYTIDLHTAVGGRRKADALAGNPSALGGIWYPAMRLEEAIGEYLLELRVGLLPQALFDLVKAADQFA